MSEAALQVESTAVQEAQPIREHSRKKGAEKRIQELLADRKRLQEALKEAQERPRPSPETIAEALAAARRQFPDWERVTRGLRLAPEVLEFLLARPEGAELLYWMAQGRFYTEQRDQHFSGVTHA